MTSTNLTHVNNFSACRAIVCDLDGTLYLENQPIPGAREFLCRILDSGRQLFYFTNNTSVSRRVYLDKLKALGFPAADDSLVTAADCADAYLRRHNLSPRIYLVGTADLRTEFTARGYKCVQDEEALRENPAAVVLAFDTEITYQKIRTCYDLITRDIPYLATHPDVLCPVSRGTFKPDIGSFIALFETAAGRRPIVVGKPAQDAVTFLSDKAQLPNDKIAFIGDRLYTDIRMAATFGLVSVLVLSGETTAEMAQTSADRARIVVNSVADLVNYL